MGIPKITEMAINNALFGGGGGKREGTAVPVGKPVERVFFNTANTIEETDALLSQLTFVQTPLLEYPIYAVYANTLDGIQGSFLVVIDSGGGYTISLIECISPSNAWNYYYSVNKTYPKYENGWDNCQRGNHYSFMDGLILRNNGTTLTDFNGIPVGAENEKIKNVLSITPF